MESIVLQLSNCYINIPCARCGVRSETGDLEPHLRVDDEVAGLVCSRCCEALDPTLARLVDVWYAAQRLIPPDFEGNPVDFWDELLRRLADAVGGKRDGDAQFVASDVVAAVEAQLASDADSQVQASQGYMVWRSGHALGVVAGAADRLRALTDPAAELPPTPMLRARLGALAELLREAAAFLRAAGRVHGRRPSMSDQTTRRVLDPDRVLADFNAAAEAASAGQREVDARAREITETEECGATFRAWFELYANYGALLRDQAERVGEVAMIALTLADIGAGEYGQEMQRALYPVPRGRVRVGDLAAQSEPAPDD